MNIPQKRKNKIENEFKAGGTDYVPPALCPRPARFYHLYPDGIEVYFAEHPGYVCRGDDPLLAQRDCDLQCCIGGSLP